MAKSISKGILEAVAARASGGELALMSKTARASLKATGKSLAIQMIYVFRKIEGNKFKRAQEMGRFETVEEARAWIAQQPDSKLFYTFEWSGSNKRLYS